nr:uncharacterized protein LOC110142483 [Odocoileus virginianus texanus]
MLEADLGVESQSPECSPVLEPLLTWVVPRSLPPNPVPSRPALPRAQLRRSKGEAGSGLAALPWCSAHRASACVPPGIQHDPAPRAPETFSAAARAFGRSGSSRDTGEAPGRSNQGRHRQRSRQQPSPRNRFLLEALAVSQPHLEHVRLCTLTLALQLLLSRGPPPQIEALQLASKVRRLGPALLLAPGGSMLWMDFSPTCLHLVLSTCPALPWSRCLPLHQENGKASPLARPSPSTLCPAARVGCAKQKTTAPRKPAAGPARWALLCPPASSFPHSPFHLFTPAPPAFSFGFI